MLEQNPKALVIGLGMGTQYALWLTELGYSVYTVDIDPNKNASYISVELALDDHPQFDIVYIGTPNWTHEPIALQVAKHTRLLLVEKPGVKDADTWQRLVNACPRTRIMMVKNNQFRPEMDLFRQLAADSKKIYVTWNNRNRIPFPGSWFTTKEKAFGGVSRDLIPHMLSYYCALADYRTGEKRYAQARQHYRLEEIDSTDYGTVNKQGTYDVDDFCEIEFKCGNTTWYLSANWKNNVQDDSSISFKTITDTHRFNLGLCPGEAYKAMITQAMSNIENQDFWQEQLNQDLWIHQQIEKF